MADIAAADVTYTQLRRVVLQHGYKGLVYGKFKLAFGNGALTYPTGGIPLDKGKLGCPGQIEGFIPVDANCGSGLIWKWDYENNKLRAFVQGATTGNIGSVTLNDYPLSTDPLITAMSMSFSDGLGAGTKLWGQLKELVNTLAVPAQTIYAVAFGW